MPRTSEKAKYVDEIYLDGISRILSLWSTNLDDVGNIIEETDDLVAEILRITISLPKQINWITDILPRFDDAHFKVMCRLTKAQFFKVLQLIESNPIFHDVNGLQFPVSVQLCVALYRLGHYGNAASLAEMATLFGIGDGSTITRITRRVFKAILCLEQDWIYWPDADERHDLECEDFPGLSLWMDGTNIELEHAPSMSNNNKEAYYDKNKDYSVKINLICDRRKRIRHYKASYPGSVHSRMFNDSNLGQHPENFLEDGEYIAADKAYKLTKYVIVPFKENCTDMPRKRDMRAFNRMFSSYRIIIEHVNGALKNTFQSLKKMRIRIRDERSHQEVTEWIIVCLILYNITLPLQNWRPDMEDGNNNNNLAEDEYFDEMPDPSGRQRRISLCNYVLNLA